MDLSLWTEASADIEGERAALRMAQAKVAVAGLWPFLTLAQSEREFEHRMALAWDHVANQVPVDLLQPIADSLRDDFRRVVGVGTETPDKPPEEDGAGPDDAGPEDEEQEEPGQASDSKPDYGMGPKWGPDQVHDRMKRWRGAAKNAEGEEEAEGAQPNEGEDMPKWLQTKINSEGAYYHQGRREWVIPQPQRPAVEFWHEGARRWITAAVDTEGNEGGGNPYYFTGGPEAGPATGMTNQFAPHPTGSDPVDPIDQMFPMQPTPWTVPPGGEWKEAPMQFNPPEGGHQAAHHAAQVGERAACVECGGGVVYNQHEHGKEWNHTGSNSWLLDDAHVPTPTRNSREAADRYYDEGVETGPPGGKNPYYFSDGEEGVAGDQSGFPQDVAQEDPDDRVNELYGASPISAGTVDNGHRVAAASPDNPPPDSDPLQGTKFDSPEEEDRWGKAERGEQQTSRDSSAMIGMRHGVRRDFYDPTDPGLVSLAFGEQFGSGNQFSMGPAPTPPAGSGGDTNTPTPGAIPQTTPPRQTPGGGPGAGGPGAGGPGTGGPDGAMAGADSSDAAAKQNLPSATGRRVHGEGMNRSRPTQENPYGTDDPFDAKTWESGINQRPRQPLEQMNPNGPQNPNAREHIHTVTSPGRPVEENDDEEEEDGDRREASRVADRLIRELVSV